MSLLFTYEIVGLFVNTLTADDKDSRYYRESCKWPILIQLSKNEKFFSKFYCFS